MLPPDSILRRMPIALPLSMRRLMGALAYAYDAAELYYSRLTRPLSLMPCRRLELRHHIQGGRPKIG
jgi:hypothetical protein